MPFNRSLARAMGGVLCAACAAPAPTSAPSPPPVEAAPAPVPAVPPDPCLAGDGGRDTLVVVLEQPVSRNLAPVPANVAERFAFRQRYETLVRLDCEGTVLPGLAERWSADPGGTVWTFELGGRHLSGGAPVTAQRIIESWRRQGLEERRNVIVSAEAADSATLIVTLARPAEGPAIFADPELAVAGERDVAGWPEATRAGLPALDLRTAGGTDLRDLLAGADLALTRDPDAIAYAERLPEFRVIPLPWDRRYWLLSARPFPAATGGDSAARAAFHAELARDVVSAAARPADPGDRIGACLVRMAAPPGPALRVAYLAGDPTSRELAERMVALAGPGFRLMQVNATDLERSILNDPAAAYLLPFPIHPGTRCLTAVPDHYAREPLVDTRAHLILRRGAARVTLDADGMPRLLPPGSP